MLFIEQVDKSNGSPCQDYGVVIWESESSGNMEWVVEDSFGIEGVLNDSKSTHHACARWFSCENGLFVLVVGIGSLLHLYSLVETPSGKQGFEKESVSHRYKRITTVETRTCATHSGLGKCDTNSRFFCFGTCVPKPGKN